MSRKMLDSGIDWIGEIPKNWQIVKVNRLFFRRKEINDSNNPTILSLARDGVKVRDISTNEGQLAESYDNYHKVYKNDLMINPMDLISGANCSLSEVEGVISPAYINLASKGECCPKYYDYFFKNQYWVKAMFIHGKGVSFDNRWTMNNETMMGYKIPMPSKKEQIRIANYLDSKCRIIDEQIENNKKSIELLEEYEKKVIDLYINNDNFEKVKIKYCTKLRNDKEKCSKNDIYIGLENIESFTTKYIKTNSDYIGSDGKKFKKGDLLINKLRPYLAKSYLAEFDGMCTGEVEVISSFNGNIEFLKFYSISTQFIDLVNSTTYGTKMPRANWNFIKNIEMPNPSIEIQNQVVEIINSKIVKIDKIINYRLKIIGKLEEYKKSLIYEAVTGKIEV